MILDELPKRSLGTVGVICLKRVEETQGSSLTETFDGEDASVRIYSPFRRCPAIWIQPGVSP